MHCTRVILCKYHEKPLLPAEVTADWTVVLTESLTNRANDANTG